MNLRFTLNDVFVLNNMPNGWQDLTLGIKRDNRSNAIYIDYTSDLTFWGDGWDRMKYIMDGVGICARIKTTIEIDRQDTGNFEFLYEGVVALSDCEIDFEKKQIKGPIKSDSYLDFIQEQYDNGVWYFNRFTEVGVQTTFAGSAIDTTDFCKYFILHNIITGDQPGASPFFPQLSYCYKVSDVLKYHYQYMTDNKVTGVSDLFSNQSFIEGQMRLEFASDLIAGDEIEIKFTNCFNQFILKTFTIIGANPTETFQEMADAFLQQGDFAKYIGTGSATDNEKAAAAYGYFDGSMFGYSIPNAGLKIVSLIHYTPITDVEVSVNGVPVDITILQELQYGMKNLFMAFNTELQGRFFPGIGNKLVNFNTLFKELDSHFNLATGLEQIEGGFQMRVEPKEYFYNKPQILDIGSVINIKAEANSDLLIQNLSVGTKGANVNVLKACSGRKQNWNVAGCIVESTDKNSSSNFDISSIGLQFANFSQDYPFRYPDDIIFFLSSESTTEKGDSAGDPVLSQSYRVKVINSGASASLNPFGLIYAFNVGLINYWAVKNHLFSFTGSPQAKSTNTQYTNDFIVKNSDSAFSRKNYEFDCILTDEQAKRCILMPIGRIGYRDRDNLQRSDSLYELEWKVLTCKAKIKVFG